MSLATGLVVLGSTMMPHVHAAGAQRSLSSFSARFGNLGGFGSFGDIKKEEDAKKDDSKSIFKGNEGDEGDEGDEGNEGNEGDEGNEGNEGDEGGSATPVSSGRRDVCVYGSSTAYGGRDEFNRPAGIVVHSDGRCVVSEYAGGAPTALFLSPSRCTMHVLSLCWSSHVLRAGVEGQLPGFRCLKGASVCRLRWVLLS